jgi:hypothetical protein|tara:strand:- start:1341 stop:1517 length:177 start_codon:yes stop_codon:yes gene_type:complete
MNIIKSIIVEGDYEDYKINTPVVRSKTFATAEKKFKGQEIVGMAKISENEIMVFVYEE